MHSELDILYRIVEQLSEKVEMCRADQKQDQIPKILEEVEQIKNQQSEILNLLKQQNQLITSRTIHSPCTIPCTAVSLPSYSPSKQRTIYVYNTITTPGFLHFGKHLQSKLNEIRNVKKHKWLQCSNCVRVKKLKNLDTVPQNAGLILLCCFSAQATLESSSIVPSYVYLRSQGHLVVCICFRPDPSHLPAKLFENSSMQEVPTYSMHVNKKGIMDTQLTNESIKSIEALLSRTD